MTLEQLFGTRPPHSRWWIMGFYAFTVSGLFAAAFIGIDYRIHPLWILPFTALGGIMIGGGYLASGYLFWWDWNLESNDDWAEDRRLQKLKVRRMIIGECILMFVSGLFGITLPFQFDDPTLTNFIISGVLFSLIGGTVGWIRAYYCWK